MKNVISIVMVCNRKRFPGFLASKRFLKLDLLQCLWDRDVVASGSDDR
jgi:hypothetical protein